jgi:hypothetical protein
LTLSKVRISSIAYQQGITGSNPVVSKQNVKAHVAKW